MNAPFLSMDVGICRVLSRKRRKKQGKVPRFARIAFRQKCGYGNLIGATLFRAACFSMMFRL
jgi:hypothetical protein